MKKAELFKKLDNESVQCLACSQKCIISRDKTGICGVRKNIDGELYLLVYEKPVSFNIDPIEKKPLHEFLPGSYSFSLGTVGCNFRCMFCQNYHISQFRDFIDTKDISEEDILGRKMSVDEIVNIAVSSGCKSISYTYNEPSIFIEFAKNIALKAKEKGLKNIFVTNGYMTKEAFHFLNKDKCIDAMNIDLKSFDDEFYKKVCGAVKGVNPILDTIKRAYETGVHIELTTLIIPNENDSEENIKKIADFIFSLDNGKGEILWHISRFFPMYKMKDKEPTSINILKKAQKIGKEVGLKKVYLGNL